MLKLKIVAVDKLRAAHWKDAAQEYLTRLSPFARMAVEEVDSEPFGGSVTAEASMKAEAERMRKRLPKDAALIALDPTGKKMTSEEFAAFLEREGGTGQELAFIIGGTAGIDPSLKQDCRFSVSLSAMTLPHELARVVLLEQLYRAATILAGKKYHH